MLELQNPDVRIFEVAIATPSGRVFKGEVFFNVTFSESISMQGQVLRLQWTWK